MPIQRARIDISYKSSTWLTVLKTGRYLTAAALVTLLAVGSVKFLSYSHSAKALVYTTHFLSVDTTAVGVLGIAASDLDDDGDIDVVTAGRDGIKVYVQTTNNAFAAKIVDDKKSERVQIIDLDQDGSQDLLVTMLDQQPSVRWYRNTGNLEFSGTAIGTGTNGKAYAGDIDADGYPDIVTATTQNSVVVLERWMNNGSGVFTSTQLSADSGVTAVSIGDVDGNGYPDIITGGAKGVQRWGTSDGYSFSRLDIDDGNTGQTHLVVADVNQDNKLDVVAAEPAGDEVIYYRNLDQRAFERIDIGPSIDATTVVVVDLDEDGDEDVVTAAQDDNTIVWLDNNGTDSFTKRTIAENLQSVFAVAISDLDNDNDFDFVAGNHFRGTVYWYERVAAKPVATGPSNITQSSAGDGLVTFTTTVSDEDREETSVRLQYSLDGATWHKPWLTSVSANSGTVNLKNSHGYQVGTSNAIDTDDNDSVTLTLKWDTKSSQNTGGPISGEQTNVTLRVIPRDSVGNGIAAVSSVFVVDNQPPVTDGFTLAAIDTTTATLSWNKVKDTSDVSFKIYYGLDALSVLAENSAVWTADDDDGLNDIEATKTVISDLAANTFYTFKLFVTDALGNKTSLPSLNGTTTTSAASQSPTATPTLSPTPPLERPLPPLVSVTPTPTLLPPAIASPSPTSVSALQRNTTSVNLPPRANAGADLVVNKDALVILDGTGSKDSKGSALTYSWRQIVGPPVRLSSANTAIPSFTAATADKSYVFSLTVRNDSGLVDIDTVTVATRPLPPVAVGQLEQEQTPDELRTLWLTSRLLIPTNVILLLLSCLLALVATTGKLPPALMLKIKLLTAKLKRSAANSGIHVLRAVDSLSGERIAGVDIIVQTINNKVLGKYKTDERGEIKLSLPVGQYDLELKDKGYNFAPLGSISTTNKAAVIYSGGKLHIQQQNQPLTVLIPLRRITSDIISLYAKVLKLWQLTQHQEHLLTWPTYIAGSSLNTVLLLWQPRQQFLLFEILYVLFVLAKIWVETRQMPSYGFVRDAITHVPLDLAVARLYQAGTRKLVMTRATNGQGKFFALPSPGRYTMTVSKPGYATFTKRNININSDQPSSIQIQADLMPVVPEVQPQLAAFGVNR